MYPVYLVYHVTCTMQHVTPPSSSSARLGCRNHWHHRRLQAQAPPAHHPGSGNTTVPVGRHTARALCACAQRRGYQCKGTDKCVLGVAEQWQRGYHLLEGLTPCSTCCAAAGLFWAVGGGVDRKRVSLVELMGARRESPYAARHGHHLSSTLGGPAPQDYFLEARLAGRCYIIGYQAAQAYILVGLYGVIDRISLHHILAWLGYASTRLTCSGAHALLYRVNRKLKDT